MPARVRQIAAAVPGLLVEPLSLPHIVRLYDGLIGAAPVRRRYRRMVDPLDLATRRHLARLTAEPIDLDALHALPESTLGGAYARWMRAQQFSPTYYREVFPPSAATIEGDWVVHRFAKLHDLHHTLLGVSCRPAHEFALQVFHWLNFGEPTGAATAVSLPWLVTHYRCPRETAAALRRLVPAALRLPNLLWFPYEEHLADDLADLRARLGLPAAGALA